MSQDYKIIFPTLPSFSQKGEEASREIVSKEIQLSSPPLALSESLSADIVRLDPPPSPPPPSRPPRLALPPKAEVKEEGALRTIGEVADLLNLPAHVIRFWETRFQQIRPSQRADGRRYYRPDDVCFLRGLSRLLHTEGYTIRGVHLLIRKKGVAFVRDKSESGIAEQDDRVDQILLGLVGDLEQLQARVKKLVA